MAERVINHIWSGDREFGPDTLSLTITTVNNPRTHHICVIGGERFKEPYVGYGLKYDSERYSRRMLRACMEHRPQLEEAAVLFQEQLPLSEGRITSTPYQTAEELFTSSLDGILARE